MSAISAPLRSREEYLRLERLAEFRSEYHRGRIVAMAGTTRNHVRIVTNLSVSLGVPLQDRPCNNYATDLRVSVRNGERYLYPDVVVTCGPEELEDHHLDILVNPLAIIEVLSPSTEAYDRGEKFLYYQSILSLREYLLISQTVRRFEVFRKQMDGNWLYQSFPFSPLPLVLQSIDCMLTFDDVYAKVEIEGEAQFLPGEDGTGGA